MPRSLVLATLLVTSLFALPLNAETSRYDPSTELTLEGNVLYVGEGSLGVYVIMKDRVEGSGQLNEVMVQLAPSYVLSDAGVKIVAGDKIRVVGSRVRWNASEMILAREVTVQGKTVALRAKDGN